MPDLKKKVLQLCAHSTNYTPCLNSTRLMRNPFAWQKDCCATIWTNQITICYYIWEACVTNDCLSICWTCISVVISKAAVVLHKGHNDEIYLSCRQMEAVVWWSNWIKDLGASPTKTPHRVRIISFQLTWVFSTALWKGIISLKGNVDD